LCFLEVSSSMCASSLRSCCTCCMQQQFMHCTTSKGGLF
jgi:hypothetical protein